MYKQLKQLKHAIQASTHADKHAKKQHKGQTSHQSDTCAKGRHSAAMHKVLPAHVGWTRSSFGYGWMQQHTPNTGSLSLCFRSYQLQIHH